MMIILHTYFMHNRGLKCIKNAYIFRQCRSLKRTINSPKKNQIFFGEIAVKIVKIRLKILTFTDVACV